MAAPTFIAQDTSGLLTTDYTTVLSVASSQVGDIFLVYTITDTPGVVGDVPVTEIPVSYDFSYENHLDADNGMSLYAIVDQQGGTNWEIESPLAFGLAGAWVSGYIQLRGGALGPNSNSVGSQSGNPATINLSTTTAASGVFALINDAAGIDKASANWASTDGYDPDTGGTVIVEEGSTGFYGFHAAYFPNIGPASTYAFSMSGGTYSYAMVALEVEEVPDPSVVGWISA